MNSDVLSGSVIENIILKNQNLMDYYLSFYNQYYFQDKKEWNKSFNKKELINLFESISLANRQKFRLYSMINFDVEAFCSLCNESEVLNNDEELKVYIKIIQRENEKYHELKLTFNVEINYLRTKLRDCEKEIENLKDEIKQVSYNTNKIKKGYW